MRSERQTHVKGNTAYHPNVMLALAYYRLSREEAQEGESASISNQKKYVDAYCKQHNITILQEFVDDGWSGGNFQRPGFQSMMQALESGKANMVITKDLSRLGRDMRESSYYAEQFFPEHSVRYLAIADNFDSEVENIMAPFQFAMNEVYLRDGSRKVKDVLRMKRSKGEYCACPPYGYKKDPSSKDRLIPDEVTAPVVQRIFRMAADGNSCRSIAMALSEDGIIPPLKYRVLYRDSFSDTGAARASDIWNYTTVKRILKNRVYLGNTILGKTKKVSVKSKKKIAIPREDWAVTEDTHVPLVTSDIFEKAQLNMGKGTNEFKEHVPVRKSIFGGIAVCEKCGHALCSAGTVYKGEREKYWFLACNHMRKDVSDPCDGVRIRYVDLLELVRQDLNSLISLSDTQIEELVQSIIARENSETGIADKKAQIEKIKARLVTIDRMISKLYVDNVEGRISDQRMGRLVSDLEQEGRGLESTLAALSVPNQAEETQENYERFFALAKKYTTIDVLDRDTLATFVERIEVGPKILPEGTVKATHRSQAYQQSVKIYYKFIGQLDAEPVRAFPQASSRAF